MNILITGSKGFIGRNLIAELKNRGYTNIMEYDKDSSSADLDSFAARADIIFHLAGVNRPENPGEFIEGNYNFLTELLQKLKQNNNNPIIIFSSSIQATLDNPYGKSKRKAEQALTEYANQSDNKVLIFRLPNVFGKWCRPNYNSVISTFCHNIANNLPITINNPETVLTLVYIDDLVNTFINTIENPDSYTGIFNEVDITYSKNLKEISSLLYQFNETRNTLDIPDLSDSFAKKLYATYLSYLPDNQLSYSLKMNTDNRGSFTEFLKSKSFGQVSINISKPGIVKGNHWHHTKTEKFLVVSGKGIIRLRNINSYKIVEYKVSGESLQVVDIPPGYTHSIENIGDSEMITVIWVNEQFDQSNPDTYYLDV